jgi:hypothetical protein
MDTSTWGTKEWLDELKAHLREIIEKYYPEEDDDDHNNNEHVALLEHYKCQLEGRLARENVEGVWGVFSNRCIALANRELREPTEVSKHWMNFKPFASWLGCKLPVDKQAAAEDTKSFDTKTGSTSPQFERSVSPQSGIIPNPSACGKSDQPTDEQLGDVNPGERNPKGKRANSFSSQSDDESVASGQRTPPSPAGSQRGAHDWETLRSNLLADTISVTNGGPPL